MQRFCPDFTCHLARLYNHSAVARYFWGSLMVRHSRLSRWAALGLVISLAGSAAGADWPQWLGPNRDDVWRETGIVETFPTGGPKVLWRVPIASGYSGPAVAGGKVFVT